MSLMISDYEEMGERDSAMLYVKKIVPMLSKARQINLIFYLNIISYFYLKTHHPDAGLYVEKALRANPSSATYTFAALHYYNKGRKFEAKRFLKKALETTNPDQRMNALKILQEIKKDQQFYKEATDLSTQIADIDDSLRHEYKKADYGALQREFDKKLHLREEHERTRYIVMVVVLSALSVLAAFVIFSRLKLKKVRKQLDDDRLQIGDLDNKIKELEKHASEDDKVRSSSAREINRLRKEIKSIEERHSGMLASGRRLMNEINDGGTTVKWTKDDMRNFVEFYKLVDLALVSELENDYNGLTYKAMTFAILDRMFGGNDNKMSTILGVQPSSVRSQRSRIEKKIRIY